MKVDSINLDIIIDEVLEDLSMTNQASERDLFKRWGYDIAKKLPTDEQLIHKIDLVWVTSYKGQLPAFKSIDEIAAIVNPKNKTELKAYFSKFTQEMEDGCIAEITFSCPTCKKESCSCNMNSWVVNIDQISRANFPTVDEFNSRLATAHTTNSMFNPNSSQYADEFVLIQPTLSYTDMAAIHLPECINVACKSEHTYFIQGNTIETSFKEGLLLFSYLTWDTDDLGDVKVPNITDAIEAVKEYLIYKYFRRKFLKTSLQADRVKYSEALQLHTMKFNEARSILVMPSFAELARKWRASRYNKLQKAYHNFLKGNRSVANLSRYPIHRSR